MQLVVTPGPHGSAQRLSVQGELDVATVALLRAAVEKALAEQPSALLLDLAELGFIDSTGCRELVLAAKAGRAADVPVEVVSPPEGWRVRRVLDFVRLAELVPVHDALPDAP